MTLPKIKAKTDVNGKESGGVVDDVTIVVLSETEKINRKAE